jgi:hypothetical protein
MRASSSTHGRHEAGSAKVVDVLANEGFIVRNPVATNRRRSDLVVSAMAARAVEVIRSALHGIERASASEGAARRDGR